MSLDLQTANKDRTEVPAANFMRRRINLDLTTDDYAELTWQVDALITRTPEHFGDNYATW